jgi:hypothetical protein
MQINPLLLSSRAYILQLRHQEVHERQIRNKKHQNPQHKVAFTCEKHLRINLALIPLKGFAT